MLDGPHHDKYKFALNLVPLVTTSNYFLLEVHVLQKCRLCVLREKSNGDSISKRIIPIGTSLQKSLIGHGLKTSSMVMMFTLENHCVPIRIEKLEKTRVGRETKAPRDPTLIEFVQTYLDNCENSSEMKGTVCQIKQKFYCMYLIEYLLYLYRQCLISYQMSERLPK